MTSRHIMKKALSKIAFYSESEEDRRIAQGALLAQNYARRCEIIRDVMRGKGRSNG